LLSRNNHLRIHDVDNEKGPIVLIYENADRSDKFAMWMLAVCGAHGWQGVISLGAGMTIGLISSVLYSIPKLRELCSMPPDQTRAEPWAITSYLIVIWLAVLAFLEYAPASVSRLQPQTYVIAYIAIAVAFLFGWGRLVLANLSDDSDVAAKIITLILAILLVVGVVRKGRDTLYRKPPESDLTNTKPPKTKGHADKLDHELLLEYAAWHKNAMWFHWALVAFILAIGIAKTDVNWGEDYMLTHTDTYLFTGDWAEVTNAKDNLTALNLSVADYLPTTPSGKFRVDYCASQEHPIGIYGILLAVLWSITSACQHRYSAGRCVNATEPADNGIDEPEPSYWPVHEKVRLIAVIAAFVLVASYASFRTILGIALTAIIAGPIVVWVVVYGPRRLYAPLAQGKAHDARGAVLATRSYRWIEYSLSATYMHVAVLSVMGILSAHEIVMTVGVFAVAMILAHFVDSEFAPLDAQLPVATHIELEKPFIVLSFFAKGVLTAALTIPFVFADKATYELFPAACQDIGY
jgi:hypothetical protein